MAKESKVEKEISIEEKLLALFELQKVNSEIDRIRTLRGELPLEVQDLEDEVAGLQTRLDNIASEIDRFEREIKGKKAEIEEANMKIARYKEQQENVRNNREYDNLSKEIEFQTLEIQLCEKRINEFKIALENRKAEQVSAGELLKDRTLDLLQKKSELNEIVAETKQEEEVLRQQSKEIESRIEERLLNAFKRIRKNAHNGLAVVTVQRDACGGCFNKIPAQRQLDIRLRKKVIVCEYCGRILVDNEMAL